VVVVVAVATAAADVFWFLCILQITKYRPFTTAGGDETAPLPSLARPPSPLLFLLHPFTYIRPRTLQVINIFFVIFVRVKDVCWQIWHQFVSMGDECEAAVGFDMRRGGERGRRDGHGRRRSGGAAAATATATAATATATATAPAACPCRSSSCRRNRSSSTRTSSVVAGVSAVLRFKRPRVQRLYCSQALLNQLRMFFFLALEFELELLPSASCISGEDWLEMGFLAGPTFTSHHIHNAQTHIHMTLTHPLNYTYTHTHIHLPGNKLCMILNSVPHCLRATKNRRVSSVPHRSCF